MKTRRYPARWRAAILLSVVAAVAACGGSAATASKPPAHTQAVGSATATSSAAVSAVPVSTAGSAVPVSAAGSAVPASAAGSAIPLPTASATATPGSGLPNFKHIYLIMMENKDYGSIVGSGAAPYENGLISRYGLATNLYAETHPSEPNYIALTSGGLQGTNSDGTYDLSVPNLFDQVETSGRTWHVYAQGYPGNCFRSFQADPVQDGPGAPGDYVRKHNPAISYTSISGNPARCANIGGLASFDPGAADFEMIIPNEINDMHSSSVSAGDAFLADFVPQIIDSPDFADSLLIITWDEGSAAGTGGGHIATIVASPGMAPGSRFDGAATHYSLLRTIELAWGMPLLGEAATAGTIALPY